MRKHFGCRAGRAWAARFFFWFGRSAKRTPVGTSTQIGAPTQPRTSRAPLGSALGFSGSPCWKPHTRDQPLPGAHLGRKNPPRKSKECSKQPTNKPTNKPRLVNPVFSNPTCPHQKQAALPPVEHDHLAAGICDWSKQLQNG